MNQVLTVQEAATVVGVSTRTLRKYDRLGILPSKRTPGGHRRYDLEQLLKFKQGLQNFERSGATLARKIFLDTRKQGKADDADR